MNISTGIFWCQKHPAARRQLGRIFWLDCPDDDCAALWLAVKVVSPGRPFLNLAAWRLELRGSICSLNRGICPSNRLNIGSCDSIVSPMLTEGNILAIYGTFFGVRRTTGQNPSLVRWSRLLDTPQGQRLTLVNGSFNLPEVNICYVNTTRGCAAYEMWDTLALDSFGGLARHTHSSWKVLSPHSQWCVNLQPKNASVAYFFTKVLHHDKLK